VKEEIRKFIKPILVDY